MHAMRLQEGRFQKSGHSAGIAQYFFSIFVSPALSPGMRGNGHGMVLKAYGKATKQ
jgi:hypothetical protein